MNAVANLANSSVQSSVQSGATVPASAAPAPQTETSQGDTVTISEQGKALAKAPREKDGGESSGSIKTNIGKDAATTPVVSKEKLAQNLQTAQVHQKSLQAKIDAAKEGGDPVGNLTAQLDAANKAVKKATVQAYS
ncbi:MAG: hypothetical protein HQK81_07200 [Desulfovibrionaceae bacterium]|nr:hypothetical protein [Desulfovibrionaceae bacterium]MBF0513838.1 hypothetical protein [Desulfovibrionaceae bacterium]